MSKKFDTILVIGASSGLGAGFVRRFHAMGKKIIATGRRVQRLQALQKELPGVEIEQMDVSDVASLPDQVSRILKAHPQIDTVMTVAGVQTSFSIKDDHDSETLKAITTEVTTNLTATIILAHLFTPHLVSLGRPTAFVTVSSGLAYIPVPLYSSYNATKAGVHAFTIGMRGQLAGTNVHVIELAPPYVESELDTGHREKNVAIQGGPEKAQKPMPLEEYLDQALVELEKDDVREAAVGFAAMGAGAWRKAFDPIFQHMGINV